MNYDSDTLDAIMLLGIMWEKAWAVFRCLMGEYFENNCTEDADKPGLSKEWLFHMFPHMQQLAFVTDDYLYQMGEALKALKEGNIIRPEQAKEEGGAAA